MFDTIEAVCMWIDNSIRADGRLSDDHHEALVELVTTNEFPLIIFFDPKNNWTIALDEPDREPFDCYWFRTGMFTPAEAKRVLVQTFQDHSNFRVLKREGIASSLKA